MMADDVSPKGPVCEAWTGNGRVGALPVNTFLQLGIEPALPRQGAEGHYLGFPLRSLSAPPRGSWLCRRSREFIYGLIVRSVSRQRR